MQMVHPASWQLPLYLHQAFLPLPISGGPLLPSPFRGLVWTPPSPLGGHFNPLLRKESPCSVAGPFWVCVVRSIL